MERKSSNRVRARIQVRLNFLSDLGNVRVSAGLLEQVTVLIGIGQDSTGAPIAGVVHQPFYNFAVDRPFEQMGRTLWAVRGCGVHGSELRKPTAGTLDLRNSRAPRPHYLGKRTLVTTRSHGTRDLTDTIEALAQAGLVDEVLKVGGAGYKVGRSPLFFNSNTSRFYDCSTAITRTCSHRLAVSRVGSLRNYRGVVSFCVLKFTRYAPRNL
jgi:hypothetical protein